MNGKSITPIYSIPDIKTPQDAARYVNAAESTRERNIRKIQVHGFLYGSGTQKLMEVYKKQEPSN